MSWKDDLQPGLFRGVPFRWAANTKTFGRRGFTYEFPKSERSLDEDLGRRATRIVLSAYCIGDDYQDEADDLEYALTREGGGMLVLPTMGQGYYRCEIGSRTESKDEGGFARFEVTFTTSRPSGQGEAIQPEADTQFELTQAGDEAGQAFELSAGKDADWV